MYQQKLNLGSEKKQDAILLFFATQIQMVFNQVGQN
jgi:hypothetical protein